MNYCYCYYTRIFYVYVTLLKDCITIKIDYTIRYITATLYSPCYRESSDNRIREDYISNMALFTLHQISELAIRRATTKYILNITLKQITGYVIIGWQILLSLNNILYIAYYTGYWRYTVALSDITGIIVIEIGIAITGYR